MPDPVAEALAKIEDESSRSRLGEEEPAEDFGGEVDVLGEEVGREMTMQAQEEAGVEDKDSQMLSPGEKAKEEVVKDENWLAGEDLEGFEGDWMAVARRRTGRVEQTTLAKRVRKGKGKGKAAIAANAAGLEKNVSKEINSKQKSCCLH